jgi:hypothetical protein
MNDTEILPINRNRPDVDRLLSDFFKSELPDPFPPLNLSAHAELPMPAPAMEPARERRSNTTKAKLSIAVSVALLIGGGSYLSGRMSDAPEQAKIYKGSGDKANVPPAIKKAMR